MKRIEVRITASFLVMLALLVMILPLKWLACAIIAAGIHECGHLLALALLKVDILGLEFRGFGVKILTAAMPPYKELLASLAGPLAGMSLILLYKYSLVLALFALGQTVFNILPMLPFDGGRAIVSLYKILWKKKDAERCYKYWGYVSFTLYGILFWIFFKPLLGFSGIAIFIIMFLKYCSDSGLDKKILRGKLIEKSRRKHKYDLPEISSERTVSCFGKRGLRSCIRGLYSHESV